MNNGSTKHFVLAAFHPANTGSVNNPWIEEVGEITTALQTPSLFRGRHVILKTDLWRPAYNSQQRSFQLRTLIVILSGLVEGISFGGCMDKMGGWCTNAVQLHTHSPLLNTFGRKYIRWSLSLCQVYQEWATSKSQPLGILKFWLSESRQFI